MKNIEIMEINNNSMNNLDNIKISNNIKTNNNMKTNNIIMNFNIKWKVQIIVYFILFFLHLL